VNDDVVGVQEHFQDLDDPDVVLVVTTAADSDEVVWRRLCFGRCVAWCPRFPF